MATIEIIDEDKNTNLHALAARGNNEQLIEFRAGPKIDFPNRYGWTPLMVAARYGHLEAVKALLDLRADATKINKYSGSVLLMAVASGNLEVVNILLRHLLSGGVSRSSMEKLFSPISMAILFNHEDVFRYLVVSRFNINSISMHTELTPIMYAALSANPIFKQDLLNNGAEPCADECVASAAVAIQQQQQLTVPTMHQPMVLISPQPQTQFFNQMIEQRSRKSSNTATPNLVTPSISPVGYYGQVFFPQDFTPTQFASPTYSCSLPYSYNQDFILSPVFAIASPSSNLHNLNISQLY